MVSPVQLRELRYYVVHGDVSSGSGGSARCMTPFFFGTDCTEAAEDVRRKRADLDYDRNDRGAFRFADGQQTHHD